MSYSNFGRGRGYPQGARAARRFGRPRFPRPPFRHAAPPRPGHPAQFGVPWQPNNMFFQPHAPLRGSPPFRADGRRRKFCNYEVQFPAPNRLPIHPNFEETAVLPKESIMQEETNTIETVPQLPLLGSEEERQQKIIETADRLKQKLSSFNSDDIPDIWNEDIPSNTIEDDTEDNVQRRIPVVGYKSSEINLTYNDLKDIGKINPDNTQYTTNEFNIANNTDSDVVMLDENKDETLLMIPNDQMTNLENIPDDNQYLENIPNDDQYLENIPNDNQYLENIPDNNQYLENIPDDNQYVENISDDNQYMEVDKEWIENGQGVDWELPQEPVDDSQNLEQSNLHRDNNIENELLESDFQYQYDTPLISISQEQDDQQQDITQGIEIYPTDVTNEPDESETLNLQQTAVSFPIDSTDQDILQKDVSQDKEKFFENLPVEESALNSHVHAENSNNSNCTLTQTPLIDAPVSNVTLDNQLPRMKENSFQNSPPELSPHMEKELPVDFDPTTPPPILLKQDQLCILPPYSIPDLPLFDPTEPPPNIKCLLGTKMPGEDANPPWSNAQNPIPAVYNNMEVHTGLNTHGGFMPQQLPLEIVNQSNVFMPPHIDSVNFSPMFPMLPSNPVINTHVPLLPQVHATPHNTCVSSSSLPGLSLSSDLHCSVNKDDGLNDMQEAMRFAKEMTSITGKTDEEPKSTSKSFLKSGTSIGLASDVESIALPPGKPKVKTNKQKKMKESVTSSKKKKPEEQSTADYPSSEETIQDANAKSKDASLMNELERPKVVFNLNNKVKIVNTKSSWNENNEKRNGMTHSVEPEKTPAVFSITKKNLENTSKRNKEEERNLKRKENNSESAISSEITNQNVISHHKKPQKDIHTEKSQRSNVSLPKVNVQNSRSRVEKNKNSKMDASWKSRIVSRFLKMSKNDIYNMVNNTSLRKFDIIMKRLVKEKKPTLSLEMRHAQDEKMKLYDQQEFMKQLNAMLDTDAIVSITDLPTEFIHHLNEVLQLDVQPDIHVESAAASSSQYGYLEDTNRTFNPVITQIPECANKTTTLNDVSQECVKNKGHAVKTGSTKNVPAHNSKNNDLNLKDDTCNPIVTNVSNVNNSLLTLQHDLDDIFSEVTKKIQTPAAVKERKRCSMGQQSTKKFDVGAISRSMEREAFVEDDRTDILENSLLWDERCDRWKMKEREDPYAYRNLTKEEWEARYGMQTNLTACIPSVSTKRIVVNKRGSSLLSRGRGRKVYPRRRYSSESSKQQLNTRHRSLEKEKHKKSRRHSDDRKHTTEYLEHDDFNHDSDSSSSSTSSSNSSNSSDDNTNVTKLLRAIKENEKVAKQMTLNEAIRDEVNAEIERERKSKKSKTRKNSKSRRQKKARYKKRKRQNKEMMSSSNSSSEKDNDNETTDRLLTEKEIKKEILENQVVQEVIVKEELDISQENFVFVNASNHFMTIENKTAHFFSASQNRVESPLAQEIPLTSINATQLHAEERLPIGSPTQLKTKAQLKQMPETSDMNDNKVPLNVFTCIPENWNTSIPASFSECTEDLNKTCETADAGCSQDKALLSTNDSVMDQSDTAHESACSSEVNENATLQQLDATARILTESSVKIHDSKSVAEISATDNDMPKASTAATSTSSISSDPPASTVTLKPGASKKIDIKTYYERTTQRRMNKKLESKKPVENPVTSTQNLITAKSTEPEIAANKSTLISTYSSSIQDPRLAKRSEENSNRTVNNDSVIQKSNQIKSKDKVSLATSSVNVLPTVVTTSKIAASKAKKCSQVKNIATDKTLQSKVAPDPKRFKNIRSEGSKELKLKKEMAKEQKAKKKPATVSKSDNLVSTKIYFPVEKTTNAEEKEKKINNVSDTNKVKIKRIQSISSHENKVNTSNVKTSTISSGNADNDSNNELPHNTIKTKERSLNLEIRERGNTEKAASNNESIDTREHSSKTTRGETHNIKRAKDTASVKIADKKGHKKIRNITPELDVSTASKIAPKVPESKISNSIEKINRDFSTEIQQSDTIKNMELSLNNTNQSQIKKSDRDLSDSAINRDSNISELDAVSRVDSIDKQSKENLLVNSNIETSSTKENDMKLNILDATHKSASANKDNCPAKKIAKSLTTSNENSRERQSVENTAISSDSVGSSFKGFLQETMMDFEQPNLFDVNYVTTSTASCKDMKIQERQDYETLESGTNYANDTNINANENFNIVFGDNLLASDKECTTNEKSDKSDLAADENGEGYVRKSSSEIVTTMLHDEGNDINIDRGNETDRQLTISKEGYASCAGLVIKESMLLDNEEELIIQNEARSKDLTSKLKTATDPSLSDALEATISDDALRLPECQSAEHLDNHIYLESNISAEKADKLPGFDSDEQLDNDIFYLDDRLQSTATFDTKDDECVHFAVDQQSAGYDIMPAVIPETTIIVPCADLSRSEISKSEGCKFDLKHISSTENNLLAGTSSMECSPTDPPRTLNIPTKAALKEAANLFLKSLSNVPTATKEVAALEILDKTQQSETDTNCQTPVWRADEQNNRKTRVPEADDNTPTVQKPRDTMTIQVSLNVNKTPAQNSTCGESIHKDVGANHKSTVTNIEKRFHSNMQREPVVELLKMKELDKLLEKRNQENFEKIKEKVHEEKKNQETFEKIKEKIYEGQKKRKDTILHRLKNKRRMKCQPKETSRKKNLAKRLKKMNLSGKIVGNTKEVIFARMLEIDLEIHKLMSEKLKLHELLQNNVPSSENSTTNGSVRTAKDDTVPDQSEIPSTSQNSEINHAKQDRHVSPPKSSRLIKERKRTLPSQDNENVSYTPRSKTPLIRWKKMPRLEQTVRQEKDEEEDEEDLNGMTKEQASTSVSKKVENDLIDGSEHFQKSNAIRNNKARKDKIARKKSDKETDINSRRSIYSDKSATDKSADERSECRDFTEGETERAKHFDTDKSNDISPPREVAKVNSQPSNKHVHSTPESLSIYTDDSTWDSLVQNTVSEMHRKASGLALLNESLKKEFARSRKMKSIVRKKKKKQLDKFLRTVNTLTREEEELPLSKLYVKKLRQKRDLLDTLSQRKEEANLVEPDILKNTGETINVVTQNKDENLFEPQLEARASDDTPPTSNASPVLQSDKHQIFVDAEANANSDWPCREKEDIEEVALQQDCNDVPDGSNHVFKAVSQDKVPFYNERNVEPDSSITPEETQMESHSSDCERDRMKNSNDVASHNFDIKVSVPKTLIKDNFSLILLQKNKDTEDSVVDTGLVDSTTNAFSAHTERLEEKDKNSTTSPFSAHTERLEEKDKNSTTPFSAHTDRLEEKDKNSTTNAFLVHTDRLEEKDKDSTTNAFSVHTDRLEEKDKNSTTNAFSTLTERLEEKDKNSTTNAFSTRTERLEEKDENSQSTLQADNSSVEKDKKDEKDEMNDKHTVNANEEEETIDSTSNTPSAPQLVTATDAIENERSNDSVESNDKISIIETGSDSNVSEKTDTKQKKPDAESEQLSNDTIALKQDCQNVKNVTEAANEEEKSNHENKSGTFEKILNNDQSNDNSVPVDLTSEKSEDEMFVEQISSLEHTSTSTFSSNKASPITKGKEMSKKLRRKRGTSVTAPTRRSTRNSNEIKSSKINETDTNSSSSGPSSRETSVLHEIVLTSRSRSKSPIWTKRDERVTNNVRKNRVSQKVQNTSSRNVSTEPETKIEDPAKHLDTITESAVSKNRTVVTSRKRQQRTDWQMKHCKVRLIDCKSILSKYINLEVLDRLGIIVTNTSAPSDSSCTQNITCDQNAAIIPIAASSFFDPAKSCDKEKSDIDILEEKSITESSENDLVQESVSHLVESNEDESAKTQYTVHKGPILDLKIFENSFLAASADGKIYRYSQKSNGILNIYKGHKSAVTCLYIYKSDDAGVDKNLVYSGSLDGTLRCYKIITGALVGNPAQTKSPIQCMDQAWGIIFIGTKSGHVSRFHIEAGAIKEDSIPFSDKPVLALKATNEGPRRILIIASRNQPINIRDASTGLLLRMIRGQNNCTVYSLLRYNNLIYCGTSSTSINVFNFTAGEQVTQYDAGVGIVCMRLYKQLLFAGCYNGIIYVFDINNHKLICSIRGPGNMVLSIEVVNNKIIAGSKDKRLHMWQMPTQVRALL